MTPCPSYNECDFYNEELSVMPSLTEVLKHQYCKNNFKGCARYQIMRAKNPQAVPQNMTPDQIDLAMQILTL